MSTNLLVLGLSLLALSSVTGLLIGGMLVFCPQLLRGASHIANRWISTRGLEKPLEKMILIDHWFYQYRQLNGAFTLVGSVVVIVFCTTRLDRALAVVNLRQINAAISVEHIDAMVLLCLMGATFSGLVSMFLLFRPSLLRDFEYDANQWVSLRNAIKPLEIQRKSVDEYVFSHMRITGAVLMCCGLYTLLALLFFVVE